MPSKSYFKKKALRESIGIKFIKSDGEDISDSKKIRLRSELESKIDNCKTNGSYSNFAIAAGCGLFLSDFVIAYQLSFSQGNSIFSELSAFGFFGAVLGVSGAYLKYCAVSERKQYEHEYNELVKKK